MNSPSASSSSSSSATSSSSSSLSIISSTLVIILIFILPFSMSHSLPQYRSPYRYAPQYCRDPETGRELYVGEVFTRPGQCLRIQCLGTLQLWEDSCLVPPALIGNCLAIPPIDINLDYPKCCPLYECKTYKSNAGGEIELTHTYDHYGNLRKSHLQESIVFNKNDLAASKNITTSDQIYYV